MLKIVVHQASWPKSNPGAGMLSHGELLFNEVEVYLILFVIEFLHFAFPGNDTVHVLDHLHSFRGG